MFKAIVMTEDNNLMIMIPVWQWWRELNFKGIWQLWSWEWHKKMFSWNKMTIPLAIYCEALCNYSNCWHEIKQPGHLPLPLLFPPFFSSLSPPSPYPLLLSPPPSFSPSLPFSPLPLSTPLFPSLSSSLSLPYLFITFLII